MSVLKIMPDLLTPTFVPDLGDTLNWNGGRVSSCTLDYFTTKGIVNPWSWRKAMSVAYRQGNVTNEELPALNYGLQIAQTTGTPIALYNLVKQAPFYGRGFHHKLPQGGQADPYRISDFCSYWPNAVAPLKVFLPNRVAWTNDVSALAYENWAIEHDTSLSKLLWEADGEPAQGMFNGASVPWEGLYPASGASGLDWRVGVLMVADGGNTVALTFSKIQLYDGNVNLVSLFQGKDVDVLPFMCNISRDVLPDNANFASINASQWSGIKCYAYPDGIIKIHFNEENDLTGQDQYSKASVAEFTANYHDEKRMSIAVRLTLIRFDNQLNTYAKSIDNAYIGVYDESGNRVTYDAMGTIWFSNNLDIYDHRSVFDGNFGENYTVRVYWDGLEQREIPIRLNVG